MNAISYQDLIFSYVEDGKARVLLDCSDYLSNQSRIPMHTLTDGDVTIPNFLLQLTDRYIGAAGDIKEKDNQSEYLLINVLIAAVLIQSSLPVKVLELGCTKGVLSYYLASLLGRFNEKSSLCCVSEVIGNDSENYWLDRITLVEKLPKISMMAADYDNTHLASGCFNIVVINGKEFFGNPDGVVKEAWRLAKKGGMIFCYSWDSPLLESCFDLYFSEREEYELSINSKILVAKCTQEFLAEKNACDWQMEVEEYLEQMNVMLKRKMELGVARKVEKQLERYIDDAIKRNELDLKIRLIDRKTQLLENMTDGCLKEKK